MTIWNPDPSPTDRPVYLSVADALAGDICCGALLPGTRLPTHRELAQRLGVTTGTITRAYAEARRRGLVSGQVGRGTFVTEPFAPPTDPHGAARDGLIDFSLNCPPPTVGLEELRSALRSCLEPGVLEELLRYGAGAGRERHREAVARHWTARGFPTAADQVVMTTGAQHGMLLALHALCRPGDTVLTEELTYMGMLAVGRLLDLRLEGVAMDDQGLVPAAFDEACRRHRAKVLYCMPTLQNPTATVMSRERREEIAAIAEQHGVAILEDDIHSFLVEEPLPSLAQARGEHGWYLDSVSKSVAGGLRVGFLRIPRPDTDSAVTTAMWATTIMAPPVMVEAAVSLLGSGAWERIAKGRRAEVARRQELARELLGEWVAEGASPLCQYLWLRLPAPWRSERFAMAAEARGVRVGSAEVFAVGSPRTPAAVRASLVQEADEGRMVQGLTVLRDLLEEGPHPEVLGV